MKNPASSIAIIFPVVGLILLAAAGFMYYQSSNMPNIDPLELWLGPAIAGGVGIIFLIIGTTLYFAFREMSEGQQPQNEQNQQNDIMQNTVNQNPHNLP